MSCWPAADRCPRRVPAFDRQILSGILLRAAADGTELAATDMELSLRVPLAARVEEPGDVVLPGRLLLEIVRALPAATSPSTSRPAAAPPSSSAAPAATR